MNPKTHRRLAVLVSRLNISEKKAAEVYDKLELAEADDAKFEAAVASLVNLKAERNKGRSAVATACVHVLLGREADPAPAPAKAEAAETDVTADIRNFVAARR